MDVGDIHHVLASWSVNLKDFNEHLGGYKKTFKWWI